MGRRKLEEQKTTLSIRVSDALRNRLERVKQMISESRGDSVSMSEAAKWFLESATDERVEAAELLTHATEALSTMYRKWEQTNKLTRADWIVLSYYDQLGCEEPSSDPRLPRPASFAAVIEAFLAVWGLRGKPVSDLDHYYLGNLERPSGESHHVAEGPVPPDYIPKVCREILDVLREPGSNLRPVFVGRNLHVALRDERQAGIEPINHALRPFWDSLWRLAARGHWLREKRPIRPAKPDLSLRTLLAVPPVEVDDFRLTVVSTDEGDMSILLEIGPKDVAFPLSPYPTIRDFSTMVLELEPGKPWHGSRFSGFTHPRGGKTQFFFRDERYGIVIRFSETEWKSMRALFREALGMPELQPLLESLASQYGEV